jgi:hypothetical protein
MGLSVGPQSFGTFKILLRMCRKVGGAKWFWNSRSYRQFGTVTCSLLPPPPRRVLVLAIGTSWLASNLSVHSRYFWGSVRRVGAKYVRNLWSSYRFCIGPCSLFAPVVFYCSHCGMNGYNTRSKPDVPVFEFLLQQTVIISKESACVVYCRQAFDAEAHGRIIFL